MRNLYIDVSHIVGWKGVLTGIERVEYNLIVHYYYETKAIFISWSADKSSFIEFPRTKVKEIIIDRAFEIDNINKPDITTTKLLHRFIKKINHGLSKDSNNSKNREIIKGGDIIILAGLWDNIDYIQSLVSLSSENKLIHVVYDMIPIVQKAYVVAFLPGVFENYMLNILPRCTGIMAISKSTADDTRKILIDRKLHVPKINTFRLGDDMNDKSNHKQIKNIKSDFILCVGTIEARKNHYILYMLQKKLLDDSKDPAVIVFAGKRGWLTSDLQYMIEHDNTLQDRIKILEDTSDSELNWLYANCLFTITPSFYEGWGLPVVESLANGKVTISSNTSSMPEAGDEFADYFSPYSVLELSKLVTKYMNKDIRTAREKFIKNNYKPYSWTESSKSFANKVMQLINK